MKLPLGCEVQVSLGVSVFAQRTNTPGWPSLWGLRWAVLAGDRCREGLPAQALCPDPEPPFSRPRLEVRGACPVPEAGGLEAQSRPPRSSPAEQKSGRCQAGIQTQRGPARWPCSQVACCCRSVTQSCCPACAERP